MKTKIISIITAAMLSSAMLLAACGQNQSAAQQSTQTETPSAMETAAPSATAAPSPSQTAAAVPTKTPEPPSSPAQTPSPIVPPEPIGTPDSNPGPAAVPSIPMKYEKYTGTYEGISDDTGEDLLYIKNLNGDDNPSADLLVLPTENTAIINAQTGEKLALGDIIEGGIAIVYTEPQLTRSIPPQAKLLALVTDIPAQAAPIPEYFEIAQVTQSGNQYTLINANGDLSLTVPAEVSADMTVFGSTAKATTADLKEGAKIFAWVSEIMESYPAQAAAQKVMVIG